MDDNRISYYRTKHHLTQKALGALVGVSDKTISHYEMGYCKPTFEHLMKLTDVLKASVKALFPNG